MTKMLKIFGIIALVLAGLLVLAVVVLNLIPGEKYKSLIASGVESATRRKFDIEGDLDIKLFSTFAFKASGIKFANADWGTKPQMTSVGDIVAEVALFPLLQGIVDVTLIVGGPDIFLETHSSGQGKVGFLRCHIQQ